MQSSEEPRQELLGRVGEGQREGWGDPRWTRVGWSPAPDDSPV